MSRSLQELSDNTAELIEALEQFSVWFATSFPVLRDNLAGTNALTSLVYLDDHVHAVLARVKGAGQ